MLTTRYGFVIWCNLPARPLDSSRLRGLARWPESALRDASYYAHYRVVSYLRRRCYHFYSLKSCERTSQRKSHAASGPARQRISPDLASIVLLEWTGQ